jgi:SAM-dependent methyltransferase
VAEVGTAHCERMIVANLDDDTPEFHGHFDAIVYADVLEHLVDPLRTLVGLNRFLAPGGVVIVSVPNVAHLWIRLLLLVGRFDYIDRGILDRTHLRFFIERSLQGIIAAAGLVVLHWTATPAPLYQLLPVRWHKPWVAATHVINAAIARALPRLLGHQLLVIARPRSGASRAP